MSACTASHTVEPGPTSGPRSTIREPTAARSVGVQDDPHRRYPTSGRITLYKGPPDRLTPFAPPDETSRLIAGHLLDFLAGEGRMGRMPQNLLLVQLREGTVANAVMVALQER